MSGLILCNMRSSEPYYISELNIRIYSIEEMGYFVYNHTYLVGREFFSGELIGYIRNNLSLEKTASKIEAALEAKSGLPELICILLKESGYYSDEEIDNLRPILPGLAQKSTQERLKAKADMFYGYNKYESSLQEYYRILDMKRDPKLNSVFYSGILGSIATIYSKLFLFEDAIAYFKKAYDLSKDDEYLRKIVLITMTIGGEKELLAIMVKYDISDIFVETCREEHEKILMDIKETQEYLSFCDKIVYKGETDMKEYYNMTQRTIDGWKEEYRDLMV